MFNKNKKIIITGIFLLISFLMIGTETKAYNWIPWVGTYDAYNVTSTSATLDGIVEILENDPVQLATTIGYYRYSEIEPNTTTPVFCNDVYGNQMISTKDIKITSGFKVPQNIPLTITGLKPSTTYYFCAIASYKSPPFETSFGKYMAYKQGEYNEQGVYQNGGNEVKTFTTLPCPTCAQTTIATLPATDITTTSAVLNAQYMSVPASQTHFEYRKASAINTTGGSPLETRVDLKLNPWIIIEGSREGSDARSDGKINYSLTGLSSNTEYEFNAVIITNPGTVNAKTLSFGSKTFTTLNSGPTCSNPPCSGIIDKTDPKPTTIKTNTSTTPLKLGQTATAPSDAIVRSKEGIETVLARQIAANTELAKLYGYKMGEDLTAFSWYLADLIARNFGYVNSAGKEIRVSFPDIAAYELRLEKGILTIYEYYNSKIVNIQKAGSGLRSKYYYEYNYFKR